MDDNSNISLNKECIHDKPTLCFYSDPLLKGECLLQCGRESSGFVKCLCGQKYCMLCYEMNFPEEKGKYSLRKATGSKNSSCPHERSNLSFKIGHFDAKSCMNNCGRSSEGYLICICGVMHCILCYEDYYPQDRGKFLPPLKVI